MLSACRTPCAFGWRNSASLWSRPRPSWLSLVGSRSDRGQTRQESPGNDLLSGPDAVLHAKPKRQLQGWDAHREISSAAQPYVSAGADAGNTSSYDQQPGRRIKHRPTRPLCLLRRRRKYPGAVQGIPGRGALLAQDVVQPQLGRPTPNLGRFPPDQRTDAVAAA